MPARPAIDGDRAWMWETVGAPGATRRYRLGVCCVSVAVVAARLDVAPRRHGVLALSSLLSETRCASLRRHVVRERAI